MGWISPQVSAGEKDGSFCGWADALITEGAVWSKNMALEDKHNLDLFTLLSYLNFLRLSFLINKMGPSYLTHIVFVKIK